MPKDREINLMKVTVPFHRFAAQPLKDLSTKNGPFPILPTAPNFPKCLVHLLNPSTILSSSKSRIRHNLLLSIKFLPFCVQLQRRKVKTSRPSRRLSKQHLSFGQFAFAHNVSHFSYASRSTCILFVCITEYVRLKLSTFRQLLFARCFSLSQLQ